MVLESKLSLYYGEDIKNEILFNFKKDKYTTLRVNTIKSNVIEIEEVLDKENIKYSKAEFSDPAYVLYDVTSEDIVNLDIYKEGKIYLQSLSSQLPPIIVNPSKGDLILDMTAAPGGKTTEMAALSNNEAMITAIEKNKQRFMRLKYNIEKQGASKVTVINTNATNIDEYFMFNKILLDAPCSGSGTISKSNNKFDMNILDNIIDTQKKLIKEAIKHLSIGGELIYSTCSILREENEEIVKYILDSDDCLEIVPIDMGRFMSIPLLPSSMDGVMLVKPTEYFEGFFVAKIRRVK